jgi:signal transduction histidine kinase
MSYPAESNQLAYQLMKLIQSSISARSLLSEMARTVGQTFGADVCLLVASTCARPKIQTGFWDGKDSSALPFEITKQFFSHPPIADILTRTEPLEIADLQIAQSSATNGTNVALPPLLVSAVQAQDRAMATWLENMPLRALLGITTYFQENANGIIMVGYLQPHQWTAKEHEWLQVAAEVGAIAYHIAQLEKVTKINLTKDSLGGTSKAFPLESNQLFKKWYDLTHQQLEQQRHLNQLQDEIITAISDRARNPLASMKLAMEMLSQDRSQPLPPESETRYWEILKQEWQRLNDLINNIVTLKKLESHEVTFNPETIALKAPLEELVRSFQEQWQEDKRKQLTIAIAPQSDLSLTAYADLQHLQSILSELLTNAGNFSLPGTTVSLSVREEEGQVAIGVTNISRGISAQERVYIFEPFRRGEGAIEQSIPGVGLGLSLVKKLVELLNGKIEVASRPTDDLDTHVTSFTLTLPQCRDRQT